MKQTRLHAPTIDTFSTPATHLQTLDRRTLLRAGLASMGAALIGCGSQAFAQVASPSSGRCAPTEDNIEGPYYLPGSPLRNELWTPGMEGTRLELAGTVLSTSCTALAGAVIEVWQADSHGHYDERGFNLRGAIRTDAQGRYSLRTILPGHYLNGRTYRPAHLHIKIRAAGHRTLTTQLYFANDPYNVGDPWIRPSLVLQPQRDGRGLHASRDLVIAAT